jgi:hypothetical protein
MKNVPDRFRIATLLIALVLGWFAMATIFAEAFTPKTQQFSHALGLPDPIPYGSRANWAAAAAPLSLRGDLLADVAMERAAPVINIGKAPLTAEIMATREAALATAKQSLSLAPHSSSMWLLVAMLQSGGPRQDAAAEALKMSYLTSPADANLIPARLAILSASAAIADVELKNLARSDIRLILTRRPDLKAAITSAYRRGSADGKAYIAEVVRSLDPGFAASLQ